MPPKPLLMYKFSNQNWLEGLRLSGLSWFVALFACVILVPGAYSIEVGFSAENGGESTDISSSYDVDTGVSVSEESTASFDQPSITNTRSVSGSGNINAVQTYSGSGGYEGSAMLSAQGASGTLQSNALIAPGYLSAKQDVSFSGSSVETGMSLANQGDLADISVVIASGIIDSSQRIQTGSVHNALSAAINAPWGAYSQFASLQGKKDSTTMTLKNSKMQPYFFNSVVDSHSGAATGLEGCYADLDAGKQIEGNDGSSAEIHAIVTNPTIPYDWNYIPSFSGIVQTITAPAADYISAETYATNGKGDQSKVGVYITDGSLSNYKSSAYFSAAKATSYQEFYKAEGNDIRMNRDKNLDAGPIPVPVGWQGVGSNSYAEIKGEMSQVNGYSNLGSAERISTDSSDLIAGPHSSEWVKTTSYQKINYAKGNDIEVGTQAFDTVGGESANAFSTVKDGYIFLYSDSSNADLSPTMTSSLFGEATALADINAVGSSIEVQTNAKNTKYTKSEKKASSVKLSASLGSEVDTDNIVFTPTVYPWKGLAILALQSNVGIKNIGHAGVGIWNEDGTWTIGSLQAGPQLDQPSKVYGAVVYPGDNNKGWRADGLTWPEVKDLLSSSEANNDVHSITGYKVDQDRICSNARPGDAYDKIALIKFSDDPNAIQANSVIDDFKNRGFWFYWSHPLSLEVPSGLDLAILGEKAIEFVTDNPELTEKHIAEYKNEAAANDAKYSGNKYWPRPTNDCLDAAVEALHAYGAKVPDAGYGDKYRLGNQRPVDYFAKLQSSKEAGLIVEDYSWNPKWQMYCSDLVKYSPDFPESPIASIYDVKPGELIQSYIDKAISGDTITISPGIFNENLVIDKSITLQGAGKGLDGTIIDGHDSGSVIRVVNDKGIPNTAIAVYLSDLLIRNGLNFQGGGIYNLDNLNIEDCTISENNANVGGGIFSAGALTITNSDISKNVAAKDSDGYVGNGGGIFNDYGQVIVKDSTISENIADNNGGGLYNGDSAITTVDGTSKIMDNQAKTGYGGGIFSASEDITLDGTDVVVKSNKAYQPTSQSNWYQGWGVYLETGVPTMTNGFNPATQVTDNTRINHPEWIVNPGELIQDYIDNAMSGDTITIKTGIFNENLVIDKSLTLIGAGSSESGTVVDGNNFGTVFSIGGLDPNIDVILKNMLIRGGLSALGSGIYNKGKLDVEDCAVSGNTASNGQGTAMGGGIYNLGTLILEDCTVSKNNADRGGGIYNSGATSIKDTTVSENTAAYAAGIYSDSGLDSSSLTVIDSTVSENIASELDGGIWNGRYGTATIDGSTISGNIGGMSGGGISNQGSMTIEGTTITGNSVTVPNEWTAIGGGGISNSGTLTVADTIISLNKANHGLGGGIINGGSATITDSTISDNTARVGGGMDNLQNGQMTVTNSIISKNTADGNVGGGGIINSGNLFIGGTSQIIENRCPYGNGGGISSGSSMTLDGNGVAIKFNRAWYGGSDWYLGFGVYSVIGEPITSGGFDPATQVTDNTHI